MIAPGLLRVALIALAAVLLGQVTGIDGIAWAIILGVSVAWFKPDAGQGPGVKFAAKVLLLWAIGLLGARLQVGQLASANVALAFPVVAVAILAGIAFYKLGWLSKPRAWLLGIGTGVCGASAIAAAHSSVGASDEDVAASVATVTLLGTAGMLTFPLLATMGWLPAEQVALLAGATLHAVPHAVGAGFAVAGADGAASASLVKMTRVALLPLVVLVAANLNRRKGRLRVPPEVVVFVFAVSVSQSLSVQAQQWVEVIDKVLFLLAFAAIGLLVDLRRLASSGRTIWAGMAIWHLVIGVAWLLIA